MSLIHLQAVQKKYGARIALEDINLQIGKGTCFGFIGPNGAGKSTLMKILVGILDEYEGEVSVFKQSLRKHKGSIQQKMGYVPQDICIEEKLTALDNMMYFGRVYGLRGNVLKKRVDDILSMVGLSDRKKEIVSTFSGGMKRRMNIGCALLHEPDIIILDEPTVGVDPQSRNHIFEIIKELKREGKTILYSSHYMEEVENLCDSIALIDQGKIVEQGTIRELFVKYAASSIFVQGKGIHKDSLKQFGEMSEVREGYMIEVEEPLKILDKIAQLLISQNVQVERLEISKPSLEDIFLSLTGSTLRD